MCCEYKEKLKTTHYVFKLYTKETMFFVVSKTRFSVSFHYALQDFRGSRYYPPTPHCYSQVSRRKTSFSNSQLVSH